MKFDEFKDSLRNNTPQPGMDKALEAMWFDARGDWDTAHKIAQSIAGKNGAWIHAYLHRKEGDISNAEYWYTCAGKKRPDISLAEEWTQIVKTFL